MKRIDPKERLIFALDVSSRTEAERYVKELEGTVQFFKVGIILFTTAGPGIVSWLLERGKKVFLDLKFFDIEETVRKAVQQVAGMGVEFLTVHGETGVIKAAVEGRGKSNLKILAVTFLTSLDSGSLKDSGFNVPVSEFVLYRAKKAAELGCDGLISSGREVKLIRQELKERLIIVTPGIRPEGAGTDDHKRWVTPGVAIEQGSDYLVVGRPIRDARDPAQAAQNISDEMAQAFQKVLSD
ncbi:MAG: orotidine-5'-phosphate decarboxylase [Candidatus Omnitrophota bacterium]